MKSRLSERSICSNELGPMDTMTRSTPSTAAERMRRYRKRRRDGMQYVRIPLHVTEIDGLIRIRFLKEEEREDAERLQTAVLGLLYWVLDDPECSRMIARRPGPRLG